MTVKTEYNLNKTEFFVQCGDDHSASLKVSYVAIHCRVCSVSSLILTRRAEANAARMLRLTQELLAALLNSRHFAGSDQCNFAMI
jgi:hypothetical protein